MHGPFLIVDQLRLNLLDLLPVKERKFDHMLDNAPAFSDSGSTASNPCAASACKGKNV
jgi:hypothetical protein